MRDTESAYRDAMIAEYEMYRDGGLEQAAAHVAGVLKEQHGYDVDSMEAPPEAEPDGSAADVPERADEAEAPENTAAPKPARAAKKAAPPRPSR